MPHWLFQPVIYDLDWISIITLAPFVLWGCLKGIYHLLNWYFIYRHLPKRPIDPDMDPAGNDNIRRNFYDYM